MNFFPFTNQTDFQYIPMSYPTAAISQKAAKKAETPQKLQQNKEINWKSVSPNRDPAQFGPQYWYTIHNTSLNYPMNPTNIAKQKMKAFVNSLPYLLPCTKCSEHAKEFMAKNNVEGALKSKADLFTFLWKFHNHVNKKLGKKQLSLQESLDLYNVNSNVSLN